MTKHTAREGLATLALLLGICIVPLVAEYAHAYDEFSYDIELIEALAQAGFGDYSALQYQKALARHPDRKDQINLARGKALFTENKRSDGTEILKQIPKNSPFYAQSRRLIAEAAHARRDWDTAASAYQDFFSKHDRPVSENPRDVRDFMTAVQAYADVAINQGNADKVGQILTYLKNIPGDAISDIQIDFLRSQATLAAADKQSDGDGEIDTAAVAAAVKALRDGQMKTSNYRLIINMVLEAAHGYILLGNYTEAESQLKSLNELLGNIPEEEKFTANSPLASAFYYFGLALKGQAQKAYVKAGGKPVEETRVKLLRSLAFFRKVASDFEANPYESKALVEGGKVRTLIGKLFPEQELPPELSSGAGSAIIEEADRNLQAGDFGRAADLYLTALRGARTSMRAPEIINKLVFCLGKQEEFLQAQALASYAAELFPESDKTAQTLLQAGALLFTKSQEASGADAKEEWLAQAMLMWDHFVAIAPNHPSAPEIAFVVAENAYSKADQLARQSRQVKGRAEKEELKEQAREGFEKALPLYERLLTGQMSTSEKGIRSLYKVAWIYYALEEPERAAESFLQYTELESNPAKLNDVLEAKFRAAEQLMSSDSPGEAVPHFEELLAWLQPDSDSPYDKQSDLAQRIRVDAASYLAWAHDLSAETLRPDIREVDQRIKEIEQKVENQQDLIAAAEDRIKQAERLQEKAREEFAAQQEQLTAGLPDPYQQALAQKMPSDAEMANWTDQEKEQRRQLARKEAADFARQLLENVRLQIQGERQDLEAARDDTGRQLDELKQEIQTLEEKLQTLKQQREATAEQLIKAQNERNQIEERIEEARKVVERAEAKIAELEQQIETAREMLANGDAAAKKKAREIGSEATRKLAQATDAHTDALSEFAEVTGQDVQQRREQLNQQINTLQDQITVLDEKIASAEYQLALSTKEQEIAVARLQTIAASLAGNNALTEIMQAPRNEREAMAEQKNWQQLNETTIEKIRQLTDLLVEKAILLQTGAEREVKQAGTVIASLQDQIAELQQEQQPIRESFEERKKLALQEFEDFVQSYPNAKQHLPKNMARIGTIALEFDQYEKAATYFDRLKEEFPDADALRDAMYNLGKSQYQTGQIQEAVQAFKDVLQTAEEQPTANLNSMARMMAEAEQYETVLQALEELLRRSTDQQHEDYDRLSGGTRQNFLFRAAEAAYHAGEYARAARYVSTLLKENERTAMYFEALILRAKARRQMSPSQLQEAHEDLSEVIASAQDYTRIAQALVEQAKVFMAYDDEKGMKRMIGQLTQLVLVGDATVTYMVDETDEEMRPYLEEALYLAARAYALTGQTVKRDLVVSAYREQFSNGQYAEQLNQLPAAKYNLQATQVQETGGGI